MGVDGGALAEDPPALYRPLNPPVGRMASLRSALLEAGQIFHSYASGRKSRYAHSTSLGSWALDSESKARWRRFRQMVES